MTCPNCGNNIPGYTKICPTCKLDTEEYTKEYETGDIDENVTQFKKFLSLTEEEKQQQFKQELTEHLEKIDPPDKEFDRKDKNVIALGICSISIGGASLFVGCALAIIGVILGVVGLVVSINIMKQHNKRSGRTFVLSIIGLCLSCCLLFGCVALGGHDGYGYYGMLGEVSGCTDKCVSDCNDFWSKMD
ncbi:MAG: hypothetical protein K6E47_11645 [Lachnospiraceae bacterium]|nr:hypothetical protein [Lachnospiraceae bacterium]